jgi:hypothetical protein
MLRHQCLSYGLGSAILRCTYVEISANHTVLGSTIPPYLIQYLANNGGIIYTTRGRRFRDRMVVGFTTTCAVSAYHHQSGEFESRSWRGVLDTTLYNKVLSAPMYSSCIYDHLYTYDIPFPLQYCFDL